MRPKAAVVIKVLAQINYSSATERPKPFVKDW